MPAKHIIVGRSFINIHLSLQYSSRSLIHASLYDSFSTCTSSTMPLSLGHSVHAHPALCLFPLVTVYMHILHYASFPWSQCTCTPCTMPLPLGHSVHVHPALCLFPMVTVYMYILHYASVPWSQCTYTPCTMPPSLGHSLSVESDTRQDAASTDRRTQGMAHSDYILHDGVTKHPVQLDLFVLQHIL